MFIDIHSHLEICKPVNEKIENARKNNVKIILTCGTDKKTNRFALDLAKKFNEIKACLGIYPCDALKLSEKELEQEIEFIRKNKTLIVGIGEVGLDLKECSLIEKQKKNLEKFIKLAIELDKPIIIHSRKAEEIAIELLEKFNYKKIIMHCFSGKLKLVRRIIDNGWFFSIPTNITYSQHFQKVVEIVPLEQLFCETDSPFLHPFKKRNNEPANVIESYKKIAEIKKISLKEIEKQVEENYKRIFK